MSAADVGWEVEIRRDKSLPQSNFFFRVYLDNFDSSAVRGGLPEPSDDRRVLGIGLLDWSEDRHQFPARQHLLSASGSPSTQRTAGEE